MPDLYDVVAVNVKTGERRPLATDQTKRDADAIVKLAVMRRGVTEEFFETVPTGSAKNA